MSAPKQSIDRRIEGVYCRWEDEEYPHHSGVFGLVIERVNGDGTVSSFYCTDDEAEVIRKFIEVPRLKP